MRNRSTGSEAPTSHNILEFEDTFTDAHVVKLEQNYRSTQTILDAANAVIRNNRGQKPKSLWTELGQGDPIKVRELDDEHARGAWYVTGEIQRLVDEGTSRAELAVFYRTNAQSRVLEDTLVRAEIGYQVIGGTKFYERAEIKDAIAYLTVLVNPQDVGSFTRIVNSPRRGIGSTSISRLLGVRQHFPRDRLGAGGGSRGGPRASGRLRSRRCGASWARWRFCTSAFSQERPGGRAGQRDVARDRSISRRSKPSGRSRGQGRIENLEELVNVAVEYDAGAGEEGSLAEFLQQIALIADADTRLRRRRPS